MGHAWRGRRASPALSSGTDDQFTAVVKIVTVDLFTGFSPMVISLDDVFFVFAPFRVALEPVRGPVVHDECTCCVSGQISGNIGDPSSTW